MVGQHWPTGFNFSVGFRFEDIGLRCLTGKRARPTLQHSSMVLITKGGGRLSSLFRMTAERRLPCAAKAPPYD